MTTTGDTAVPSNVGTAPTFEIRPLEISSLLDCAAISARCFGFSERDQIPPWLIQTFEMNGAVTLGAYDPSGMLLGYSVSFPGFDGTQSYLFACGLAVDAPFASHGIATALKQEQRKRALATRYRLIKWTTESVSAGPLYTYLHKLGARLTGLRDAMYADTLGWHTDEVEIDWHIDDKHKPLRDPSTSVPPADPGSDASFVEIPWDRHSLLANDPDAAVQWSLRVRDHMRKLLDAGYVGTDVLVHRDDQRVWVKFEQSSTTA